MVAEKTNFDPYEKWLGIPASIRPINHYLLLGIEIFESRAEEITNACDQRMVMVRQYQSGPRGAISEQLLTELALAKQALLDPQQRQQYDIELRQSFAALTEPDDMFDELISLPPESSRPIPVVLGEANEISHEENPLLSLKNLMIFLLVVVGSMLATIYLLTKNRVNDSAQIRNSSSENATTGNDVQHVSGSGINLPSNEQNTTNESQPPIINQSDNDEIILLPSFAVLAGKNLSATQNAIMGWSEVGDSASWRINVKNRRTGFFHCDITYQVAKECRLHLQIEGQPTRSISLYPHESKFTERLFVRLGSDVIRCKVSADQLAASAELQVFELKLIPK